MNYFYRLPVRVFTCQKMAIRSRITHAVTRNLLLFTDYNHNFFFGSWTRDFIQLHANEPYSLEAAAVILQYEIQQYIKEWES
jgi:hypothetical protein